MPHACRCPYCERAIYTSGTGLHSFRASLLLHLLRCEKKPAHMTDKELAAVADRSVAEALGTGSVN